METVNTTSTCSSCFDACGSNELVRRLRLVSILFAIVLFFPPRSSAQQVRPTEQQVKAAYLFNFGKFVRWPSDHALRSDSLEMCVLGKDPFGELLDSTVAGESIEGRKINVRRLVHLQDSAPCNILFVSSSEEGQLAPILKVARQNGTLTVSDIPNFAERGGIIGFVMQQGRIRFAVNREAAEQSRLTLSSELLKVASQVIANSAPPPGSPQPQERKR